MMRYSHPEFGDFDLSPEEAALLGYGPAPASEPAPTPAPAATTSAFASPAPAGPTTGPFSSQFSQFPAFGSGASAAPSPTPRQPGVPSRAPGTTPPALGGLFKGPFSSQFSAPSFTSPAPPPPPPPPPQPAQPSPQQLAAALVTPEQQAQQAENKQFNDMMNAGVFTIQGDNGGMGYHADGRPMDYGEFVNNELAYRKRHGFG